jgi:hypothetical protein
MNLKDIEDWLRGRAAAWPADRDLGLTRTLRERLASLPGAISGVSLAVLKDTALPAWKDGGFKPLAKQLHGGKPPDGEAALAARLKEVAPPAATGPATEDVLAPALAAARALRGLGEGDLAAGLLAGCVAATCRQPEQTCFALWLDEVARAWLGGAAPAPLRARVLADLGRLLALVGDARGGTTLIRDASRLVSEAGGAAAAAWLLRYEAAECGLRTRTISRADSVAELKAIQAGAPEASAAWFHAGFELIFATAAPGSQAGDLDRAGELTKRLEEAGLPAADQDELRAHAHEVLGHALHFGNKRTLHAQARDEYQKAVDLYRGAGDWPNLAQGLDALGRVLTQLGDHEGAGRAFDESIELKQKVKDLWGLGASFNGLGSSRVRRGKPLEAIPLYDANLALLGKTPGASRELVLQNLGQKVTAYLAAYQDPFTEPEPGRAAEVLRAAKAVLDQYEEELKGKPGLKVSAAYYLMLGGALARLEARLADDPGRRLDLLSGGEVSVRRSIEQFHETGDLPPLPNAYLHLAGLLTDHARALDDPRAQEPLLRDAWESLRAAEGLLWDSYERAYLELAWAWYYWATTQYDVAENHLGIARLQGEVCGDAGVKAIDVRRIMDAQPRGPDGDGKGEQLRAAFEALDTSLCGPTGKDRWSVVLPPGTRLAMTISAVDRGGKPSRHFPLRATLVGVPGASAPKVRLTPAADQTDDRGRVTFTLQAPAEAPTGTVEIVIRDHGVYREARATVHVCPFDIIRVGPALADNPLGEPDQVVLRNLFGPRFRQVDVLKEFGSGLSGSRVFLVEPLLTTGQRGQPCLVKIGERRQIHREIRRYEDHVQDILPPNVSRIAQTATWDERAGIRMSLAGDQDWDRADPEIDWLFRVPTMETRHLLDDLFIRDLGDCWYANRPERGAATLPLYRAYGRAMPALLTLREAEAGDGLRRQEVREPRFRITEGLKPPGEERLAERGQTVYLGPLRVEEVSRRGDEWEYELHSPGDGLRVLLRTRAGPHVYDKYGIVDNLFTDERYVRGVIEEFAFDRLLGALRADVEAFRPEAGAEQLVLSPDGATLEVRTREENLRLCTPLFSLHKYLEVQLPHHRSIIHGDLHTRNVIVSPRGMPYYIDFGETEIGPTLFDFIKQESYLWSWSVAGTPDGPAKMPDGSERPLCTLTEAVRLMRALTSPGGRFPDPLALPGFLSRDRHGWQARFYQCVGKIRALARDRSASPADREAPDYFLPLAVYSALMVRWCHPDHGKTEREKTAYAKTVYARQGVFLTILAALLLDEGVRAQRAEPDGARSPARVTG